jgi:hypothetical protein
MPDCIKGGYGIYADGKWYPFDAKGNELAKALFEKTAKKDQIKMTVEGMTHDGKVLVSTITEAHRVGGSLAAPVLPHHRTCGSASGGSV